MSHTASAPKTVRRPGAPLEPIVASKIVPPRVTNQLVSREQLQERLSQARRGRCITVHGPAGCGKTTTIVAWRQKLLQLGFDVAWLAIAAEDNDISRFLDYLLASVGRVDPAIVHDAQEMSERGNDAEAVERTLIALQRGIKSHPRDVAIVLDDLHHLTEPAIHAALQWLLDHASQNLLLILISRDVVPLSLTRLRDQEILLELETDDMRFTRLETEAFLMERFGDVDARTVRLLHRRTDGWVAGLQLLSIGLRRGDEVAGHPYNRSRSARLKAEDPQAFVDYFDKQVLERLSVEEVDLLVRSSLFERFCAPLCAATHGRPGAIGDVEKLLSHLESANAFIIPIERSERETWYRLHPLLREALSSRLLRLPAAERISIHAAASTWFRDNGLLDEAVRHAVEAGDPSAAAALLEDSAQRLYASGALKKLVRLVRMLPAEQVRSRVGLSLWLARSQLFARELDACAASIAVLRQSMATSHALDRYSLTLLEAALAVQRDDTDGAMALLPQLHHAPAGADAIARGGRNNILSWLHMHRGEYAQARSVQAVIQSLIFDGRPLLGTTAGILMGRCLIGLSHALEGDMTQAERCYRDVLRLCEQYGGACVDASYLATALLGEALHEGNDSPGAIRLLEDRLDLLERVSIPDSVLRVMLVLSRAHWLHDRQLECFAYLERLEDYAVSLRLDRLLAQSLGEQVHRRLQIGEHQEAKRCLSRLDEIAGRNPRESVSALGYISVLNERAHVRWDIAHDNYRQADQRLVRLLPHCEARGRQQVVAHLRLQRAMIQRHLGSESAARVLAAHALDQGRRLGLVRSLLDAAPNAIELISQIAEDADVDPLIAFHAEQVCAAHSASTRLSAASRLEARMPADAAVEPLSEREIEIVRMLGQALPNKKIARSLGLSPETVKWHLKNVYGKLGVTGRDEALSRVRDLGLA